MDDMKKCAWVRPEAVARIEYLEWTEGDHLRHSKLAGLREDKNPRNVVKEHASSVVSWSKLLALRSIPVLCWIVAIRPLLIDSIQNRFGVADCIFYHCELRRTRSVTQLHQLASAQECRGEQNCVLSFFGHWESPAMRCGWR